MHATFSSILIALTLGAAGCAFQAAPPDEGADPAADGDATLERPEYGLSPNDPQDLCEVGMVYEFGGHVFVLPVPCAAVEIYKGYPEPHERVHIGDDVTQETPEEQESSPHDATEPGAGPGAG